MATTSTFIPPEDLSQRWSTLADTELTSNEVDTVLKCIPDDYWVAFACVDRILEDVTVQRSLLDLGLERTLSAVDRSKAAYADGTSTVGDSTTEMSRDDEAAEADIHADPEEQTPYARLFSHFRTESVDAQLCRVRQILLNRLDRLNTYVEIHKDATKTDADDSVDEEWEDDPWAEEADEEQGTSATITQGNMVMPLSIFLTADVLRIACLLASMEHFVALRLFVERHGEQLWPYRFHVLDSIPEHTPITKFKDLLPIYDPSADREHWIEFKPWRSQVDFSETSQMVRTLADSELQLKVGPLSPTSLPFTPQSEPLSSSALVAWYEARIDLIISRTGMIDSALQLVQHAASQGLPGLDEMGEELSLLSRLVYDVPVAPANLDDDWSLKRWKSMGPSEIILAYLAHSTPRTVARDINRLVMPYLFVLESRAERAGSPDPQLPTRLLYQYILAASIEIVAAVFEASKPTFPPVQRVIRNDEDMARLALACLYGSDRLDAWSAMSRIFECLPAWDVTEDDDEADEADTTVSSLGAFVMPSSTRPRCSPADLMIFFTPLPSSSLSRLLDVLDVHLESGEILARWGTPAPLRWFLQSNSNITDQRAWANRLARRAGGSQDKLDSQDDWEWLLEDMLKLSETGNSGSWSAFCLLSKDDVIRTFFSGLLSTGQYNVAKNLLYSSAISPSMNPQVIEEICLTCSQEFYDNASSGNYHFGDMKLAYDCLDIPSPSKRVIQEKEFIEATSRLCSFNLTSRPGIPITPLEIRLTKDRLSLVSRVLSSNNDAYKHTQVILDLVHKLGYREDPVAEAKTLAMLAETALQAGDFTRAYETSDKMVNAVVKMKASALAGLQDHDVEAASEVCWVGCFQLGRHPEFEDVQKKLTLLGRALEFCPADQLVDVLAIFRQLEEEDAQERRERMESRRTGTRPIQARKRGPHTHDPVSSLTARLQHLHMPDLHISHSPLANAPDAAALANKAFSRVAANFPFSVGARGRTAHPEANLWGSREGSRSRVDGGDVSAQATRVLQAGIGWLLGGDEDS